MKKAIPWFLVLGLIFFCNPMIYGQAEKTKDRDADRDTLSSEKLDNEGKELDNQIADINRKIERVVGRYKLLTTKDIRFVPFQVTYNTGSDYIEIEKHNFIQEEASNKFDGIRSKSIKIFTNGSSVSRIEAEIYEKNYHDGSITRVLMVDNAPGSNSKDGIIFTHMIGSKKLVDGKKLSEIKNTTAFPIRNNLKRDFIIPHLSFFYSTILNIAETYNKGIKDSESIMTDFLRKSTEY